MAVVIGLERLPSIEILGKDWQYNVFASDCADKLINIVKSLKASKPETVVRDCKKAISLIFVEGVDLVKQIDAIYKDNPALWTDALVQVINEVKNPKIKAVEEEIERLRKGA